MSEFEVKICVSTCLNFNLGAFADNPTNFNQFIPSFFHVNQLFICFASVWCWSNTMISFSPDCNQQAGQYKRV